MRIKSLVRPLPFELPAAPRQSSPAPALVLPADPRHPGTHGDSRAFSSQAEDPDPPTPLQVCPHGSCFSSDGGDLRVVRPHEPLRERGRGSGWAHVCHGARGPSRCGSTAGLGPSFPAQPHA